ncbi:MAG: hormogonium polysaccharide biosynthesis acetyltransferase HpsU [Cyanobacteria bacterium J06635_1]
MAHTPPDDQSNQTDHPPTAQTVTTQAVDEDRFGATPLIDLSQYHQPGYEVGRPKWLILIWWLAQAVVFPLTLHAAHGPRRALLRLFGAKIGKAVMIRPTARFTYPWKVEIGDYSWVGDDVVFYSLAPIRLGQHCVVSQKTYLCTGSHDVTDPRFALMTAPITLGNGAWVATDCFVGPGVTIGANTVIGARSSVFSDMPPQQICLGTPCRPCRPRVVNAKSA